MKIQKIILSSLLACSLFIPGYEIPSYAEKVSKYIQQRIEYKDDSEDDHPGSEYMQSAFETFIIKKGDCEDYSNLATYFMRKKGYISAPVTFYERYGISGSRNPGHAVCVYVENRKFGVIDSSLKIDLKMRFKSLYEIGRATHKDWELSMCKNSTPKIQEVK